MTSAPHGAVRKRDEAGATLVLALIFLVAMGSLVGALASWTSNDLSNALVFQNQRVTNTALNSATQVAIENIRYNPLISADAALGSNETLNASPPEYCWGTGPGSVLTTQRTVATWCSTTWNPASTVTRTVTISACVISSNVTTSNWASLSTTCASQPGLQTVVSFDDYQTNLNNSTSAPCTATCGTGMTVESSSAGISNIPTVTGLLPPSGPVTGGTSLTITGTNFVNNATSVYFIDPNATNLIASVPAQSVTFNSATSISVTTPVVTTSGNYYVLVSTPNGGSFQGAQSQFSYLPVVPTVTGLSPITGSASGGTALTITGQGFLSNDVNKSTVVTFTNTANGAITATAPSVEVDPTGTIISATAPAITAGTTYYVTVTTTPGGTTQQSANFEFTFQPYYPVADSISPGTGGNGTTVTVTGLGFLSGGTTVTLIPTAGNGSSLTLTGVSVSSPTSLTGRVPSGGTNNGTYYVSITTSWNGTPYQSCNSNGNNGLPTCMSVGAPTYTY